MGNCFIQLDQKLQEAKVNHPSLKLFASFHGRMVKTFSTSLPEKGKWIEVVTRIGLVAASIFAYPVLGFIALVGYPLKAGKISQNEKNGSGENLTNILRKNIDELKGEINEERIQNFLSVVVKLQVNKKEFAAEIPVKSDGNYCLQDLLGPQGPVEQLLNQASNKQTIGQTQDIATDWHMIFNMDNNPDNDMHFTWRSSRTKTGFGSGGSNWKGTKIS